MAPRFLRWVAICLSMPAKCFLNNAMRSRMTRRSVSISFSPGPFIPMPPFCFCRCVHMLVKRGRRYWYCASSTWVLAWAVAARWAKMSKIKLVRSRIFRSGISFSMLRNWMGLSSSSKTIMSISSSSTYSLISCSLPDPTKVRTSGLSMLWMNTRWVSAFAVSARKASSSRYSSNCSRRWCLVARPMSTHVSAGLAVERGLRLAMRQGLNASMYNAKSRISALLSMAWCGGMVPLP